MLSIGCSEQNFSLFLVYRLLLSVGIFATPPAHPPASAFPFQLLLPACLLPAPAFSLSLSASSLPLPASTLRLSPQLLHFPFSLFPPSSSLFPSPYFYSSSISLSTRPFPFQLFPSSLQLSLSPSFSTFLSAPQLPSHFKFVSLDTPLPLPVLIFI